MSYCRWGPHSDVYMYEHVDGHVTCCYCRLRKVLPHPWWYEPLRRIRWWLVQWLDLITNLVTLATLTLWHLRFPFHWHMWSARYAEPMEDDPHFETYQGAFEHLQEHLAAGHKVPQYAFERLAEDIATGLKPGDPAPPCKHGIAEFQQCVDCRKEWLTQAEENMPEDASPFGHKKGV